MPLRFSRKRRFSELQKFSCYRYILNIPERYQLPFHRRNFLRGEDERNLHVWYVNAIARPFEGPFSEVYGVFSFEASETRNYYV